MTRKELKDLHDCVEAGDTVLNYKGHEIQIQDAPPDCGWHYSWQENTVRSLERIIEIIDDSTGVVNMSNPDISTVMEVAINAEDWCQEYDTPDEIPEWAWIEKHANFAHTGNMISAGVWEFMVHVESTLCLENTEEDGQQYKFYKNVPETLQAYFFEAYDKGIRNILFYQE